MNKDRYHIGVMIHSWSDNNMKGTRDKPGEYNLPYRMKHMLEIERWVEIFRPEPLYNEVKDHITKTNTSLISEGDNVACETCKEVKDCGFDYKPYFTEDEYQIILSKSRACSLNCAIKDVFRGDYAPSVAEFKQNPDAYKTLGAVG